MAEADLVIRGGTVVDANGSRRADVAVRDGLIVAVGEGLSGDRELDAGGCVVGPGLVDLHAHLREPGKEEAETVETGARAAARGGFTAVVAMPNTTPAIDSASVVREVQALGRARKRADHVDRELAQHRRGSPEPRRRIVVAGDRDDVLGRHAVARPPGRRPRSG